MTRSSCCPSRLAHDGGRHRPRRALARRRGRAAVGVDPAHRRRRRRAAGDLLAAAADPVPLRQEVTALACWLGDEPLRPGARLLVKHGSRTVLAVVRSIDGRLDLDALRLVPTDRLVAQRHRPRHRAVRLAAAGRGVLHLAPRWRLPPRRPRRRPHPRRGDGGCRRSRRAPAVTLPVGLDLTGRRALVVGGGPVVARGVRARSWRRARSSRVVAPWLCEELERARRVGRAGLAGG